MAWKPPLIPAVRPIVRGLLWDKNWELITGMALMLLGQASGVVRDCNLGGPVPQGRQCGWVEWVGRGMRASKYL